MLDLVSTNYPHSVNHLEDDPTPRKGCSFCGAYTTGGDWCERHAATEGPEVRHVAGMIFQCESFTRPNVFYTVSLAGVTPACSCPARKPCKHPGHVQPQVERLQTAQVAVWVAERAARQAAALAPSPLRAGKAA